MPYQKITLQIVVDQDNSEMLLQALNDAMDKIEEQVTVFSSAIMTEETSGPENADEIAARPTRHFYCAHSVMTAPDSKSDILNKNPNTHLFKCSRPEL